MGDEQRRLEIEELRRDEEQERFERRDSLNHLRYEFEEFVRRKIEKVLEHVEGMKSSKMFDEATQQQQVDYIVADFGRMKDNLFGVQSSWGKLVSNCVTPAQKASITAKNEKTALHLQRRGRPQWCRRMQTR